MADGNCTLFDDVQDFQTGGELTGGAGLDSEFALRHGLDALGDSLGATEDGIEGGGPTGGHLPFDLGQACVL